MIPAAERNTPEWGRKFEEVMQAIEAWESSTYTTPAGFYREKTALYLDLFTLAPEGRRDQTLRTILSFIAGNPIQKSNRMEWFLPVNGLIGRIGLEPGSGKLAELLRESKDPVVALYARLEALAPRTPDQILPLL